MANPSYNYATTLRWGRRRWVVVTGTTPWTRYLFDRGFAGDHARWLTSPKRPESFRRQVLGTERVLPGPWPFGLTWPATLHLQTVDIDILSELAGLTLTAWALASIVRHPRRNPSWPT